MGQRSIGFPWGPYCWTCEGAKEVRDGWQGCHDHEPHYMECPDCVGTGRAAIPWSELFTHGGVIS